MAAAVVATLLIAGLVCDWTVRSFRVWWERHALSSSAISSLLVVGVTALIFDEVVARRQRSERAVTVAVQGLILYRQATRTYETVTGGDKAAADEMRILASMLLIASPPLFEDPEARTFLEDVERLAAAVYGALSSKSTEADLLSRARARMDGTVMPLIGRLPSDARAAFGGD